MYALFIDSLNSSNIIYKESIFYFARKIFTCQVKKVCIITNCNWFYYLVLKVGVKDDT